MKATIVGQQWGLNRPRFIMVDKVRAIDRTVLGDGPLTTLTRDEMTGVEKSLRAVLGMY